MEWRPRQSGEVPTIWKETWDKVGKEVDLVGATGGENPLPTTSMPALAHRWEHVDATDATLS